MKSGAPTMKDVAQEAGVALGTVSKVFSGGNVGERYRIKVEQAAQKLGYEVNRYNKASKVKEPSVIAVIIPDLIHPFFAEMVQHLHTALTNRGLRMQLMLTGFDPRKETECLQSAKQLNVDGIIGMIVSSPADIGIQIPFVTIDRGCGQSVPCISSDNYSGGSMAAEKLMELGCRHLAFLRTGVLAYGEVDKRGDGFEAACRVNRVQCDVCWLNDENDYEPFREFFQEHMTGGKLDFDGIGCATDLLAWRIIRMLREMGIRVPEDVQVIGYDGLRHFSSESLYCSSIVQPIDLMAETCVETLLDTGKSKAPSLVCLPVTYQPGGTTRD